MQFSARNKGKGGKDGQQYDKVAVFIDPPRDADTAASLIKPDANQKTARPAPQDPRAQAARAQQHLPRHSALQNKKEAAKTKEKEVLPGRAALERQRAKAKARANIRTSRRAAKTSKAVRKAQKVESPKEVEKEKDPRRSEKGRGP